jgi:UDP-N-acetylglucosamine 2-epimerase (non-hydrolysing)
VRIVTVCGARPNVMKVAALAHAFREEPRIQSYVVHTGQHYDPRLSGDLFAELGLPPPEAHLHAAPDTPARQLTAISHRFGDVIADLRPDWVVVVGDVTSTLACAMAATGRGVPLAHVEAGLRSFDDRMPEERNRRLTDHMSALLFATEPSGVDNLRGEGIDASRIHLVGNVMIDVLLRERSRAEASDVLARLRLVPSRYVVATLHRPENVDVPETLCAIVDGLRAIGRLCPVAFVVHPRTRGRLEATGIAPAPLASDGVQLVDPLGYHDFVRLQAAAAAVVTDSGGVQEETTVLGIPCLTLRRSTERPITLEHGSNRLVALTAEAMLAAWTEVVTGQWRVTPPPPLWDGRAAERITRVLVASAPPGPV